MWNDNSAHGNGRISMTQTHMVNSGRTSYTLSNLQRGNIIMVTRKLDGGDTTGIDHAQEGIVDQHALNDQFNDINDFSWDDFFLNPLDAVSTFLVGFYLGIGYELLSWTCVFKSKFSFSL